MKKLVYDQELDSYFLYEQYHKDGKYEIVMCLEADEFEAIRNLPIESTEGVG